MSVWQGLRVGAGCGHPATFVISTAEGRKVLFGSWLQRVLSIVVEKLAQTLVDIVAARKKQGC